MGFQPPDTAMRSHAKLVAPALRIPHLDAFDAVAPAHAPDGPAGEIAGLRRLGRFLRGARRGAPPIDHGRDLDSGQSEIRSRAEAVVIVGEDQRRAPGATPKRLT